MRTEYQWCGPMRGECYLTTTLGMYISPNPSPVTTLSIKSDHTVLTIKGLHVPVAPDEDAEGGGEAAGEEAEAGQDGPRHTDWAAAVSGDQGPYYRP